MTRDSVHGYAWLSRDGVLHVYDPANMPTGVDATLDDADYTASLDVSFDVERCINVVTVKHLRRNLATGETVEVPYGPFEHKASRAEWGSRSKEFTVQGLNDDDATMRAFAEEVFAANAVPERRVNSLTVVVRGRHEVTDDRALVDLYDLHQVTNANGIDQTSRVTKVTHRITPAGWFVDLGYEAEGGVAAPQATPPVQNAVDAVPLFAPTTIDGTATTSIPNNAITHVATGWAWGTNTGLVTVASAGTYQFVEGGTYLVLATLRYTASGTGRRMALIYRSGAEAGRAESGPGSSATQVSHLLTAAAGDTLDVRAFQTSGAGLALVSGHQIRDHPARPGRLREDHPA